MDTPSIFISHGSPMIALEPGRTGEYLQMLGPALDAAFGRPRAIVAISAHTLARQNVVLAAARHTTVHDFGGFPDPLYQLRYDAPGEPAVAARVVALLQAAGIASQSVEEGGLDHGIWTALRYVYPDADVPIVPVAMRPDASPAEQFALGEALAPLRREGILVLGTGSITHNLRMVAATRRLHGVPVSLPEVPASAAFRAWMHERSTARDWPALFDYRRLAPGGVEMHPSDEHLLPWYVAAGAGGRVAAPVRLFADVTLGSLGMDLYAFGPEAARLVKQVPKFSLE